MRLSIRSYKWLLGAAVISTIAVSAAAQSQLTEQDRIELTTRLDSLRVASDETAAVAARAIFTKTSYNKAAWVHFFSNYFSSRSATVELGVFLCHRSGVFFYGTAQTRTDLQSALGDTAFARISSMLGRGSELGPWIVADTARRDDLLAWLKIISFLARFGETPNRRLTYTTLTNVIASNATMQAGYAIPPATQPYVNYLRMQLHMSLRDSQPRSAAMVEEIASTLHLTGARREMWRDYNLLVHDNEFLNARDWEVIRTLWDLIPLGLQKPVDLCVFGALGNVGEAYRQVETDVLVAINIFDVHAPGTMENGFPPDVEPYRTSFFANVLAHELNHIVDADLIYAGRPGYSARLSARRAALIADAGVDRSNYLRSILPDAFFVNAPQEFFASIANMYFANTDLTFRVGRARLDAGKHQPLEQFLFFVDVYSTGGDLSRGYAQDESATFVAYDIPLRRDSTGRIVSMLLPSGTVDVFYGADGHVNKAVMREERKCPTAEPPGNGKRDDKKR